MHHKPMNVVMIIPTGIGCDIGGHCGDANPVARLLAYCSDKLILHPNVVNASDLNEMTENSLYVEGSMLDRFLEGKIFLEEVNSNKILVVVNNKADYQSVNAVSAARMSIGVDAEILELNKPLNLIARIEDGKATGDVENWEELVEQVKDHDFDVLGLATPITIDSELLQNYLRNGGVNPVGGVEAVASKLISGALDKPAVHGPVDYYEGLTEVVDPRIAVEIITMNYIHCVLKGLHRAPRINHERGLGVKDVDCMISPYGCFGRPHEACLEAGIPVIVVRENKSCLDVPENERFIYVENYLEAVGMITAMKAGVHPPTVRRPVVPTVVKK